MILISGIRDDTPVLPVWLLEKWSKSMNANPSGGGKDGGGGFGGDSERGDLPASCTEPLAVSRDKTFSL